MILLKFGTLVLQVMFDQSNITCKKTLPILRGSLYCISTINRTSSWKARRSRKIEWQLVASTVIPQHKGGRKVRDQSNITCKTNVPNLRRSISCISTINRTSSCEARRSRKIESYLVASTVRTQRRRRKKRATNQTSLVR